MTWIPDHVKTYGKYFSIRETPLRGIMTEANQETIKNAEKNFG